ncbi:MAG: 1-acyl-sn-glycerol-3-phosphate acyltransferase [Lachnospiraceae bacterium]|nr:1-acyl-sn-glycerol-3-phosphate acyltransferase [Lachnospiraceae bacterium]
MFRFIIVVLYVALFLLSALPYFGIEWILGRCFDKRKSDLRSLHYVQWGFRVVLFLSGVKVTFLGDENIPKGEPVLYAANHRGMFDIVSTYSHVPDLTGFISKDNLLKVPILPFVMKRIYCLFLNRRDPKEGMKTITASFDYIRQGVSMFIFPEGTRNRNEDSTQLLMMHNGSFKAAQRTGCPVIPVAISNSDLVLEKQFPRIRPAHIVVRFGKPVFFKDIPEDQRKNIGDYFADIISGMLKENAQLL